MKREDYKKLLDKKYAPVTNRVLMFHPLSKRAIIGLANGVRNLTRSKTFFARNTSLQLVILLVERFGRKCFYYNCRGIGKKTQEEIETYLESLIDSYEDETRWCDYELEKPNDRDLCFCIVGNRTSEGQFNMYAFPITMTYVCNPFESSYMRTIGGCLTKDPHWVINGINNWDKLDLEAFVSKNEVLYWMKVPGFGRKHGLTTFMDEVVSVYH